MNSDFYESYVQEYVGQYYLDNFLYEEDNYDEEEEKIDEEFEQRYWNY